MDIFNLVARLTLDTSSYEQKLQESGSLLGAFSSGTKKAAETFTPLSRAVFGFGQSAVQTAMTFDASMQKVIAINGEVTDSQVEEAKKVADEMGLSYEEGANATETALNILRAKAEQMGKDTMFTASQAADALTYMAMAGWKTSDMLQGIGGVMSLAAAGGSDLAYTSDIVTDALTAMGHGAEDAGRLSDIMAAAATNSNTNVEMMGETFKYAAPLIGAMGYSMEDTALAIGLMANSGTKASRAGTALRSILTRLADPTEDVSGVMSQLGISLEDENHNMLSLREVMQQLRSAFGNLSPNAQKFQEELAKLDDQMDKGEVTEEEYAEAYKNLESRYLTAAEAQKAQAASTLAGKYALSGLLAIVNSSDEDFNKLAEAIDGSTGSAEQMSDIMLDSLSGNITNLKSKFEALQITLAEVLMPYLNKLVDWAKGFLDWMNSLDDKTVNTIVTIGTFVAVLAPVLGIISKLASGISLLITIGGGVIKFLGILKPMLTTLFSLIMTNPVLATIALIATAIALLWANSETFREIVTNAIHAVGEAWEWLKNAVVTMIETIVQNFQQAWQQIQQGWEAFKEGLAVVWEAIVKVFSDAWEGIKQGWEDAKEWIAGIPDKIKEFFDIDWSQLGKDIIEGLKNGLLGGINKLKSAAGQVGAGIKEKFTNFFQIGSPSKLMAEYGGYIDEGLANGIEDNQRQVEQAMNGLSNATMGSFDPKLSAGGVGGTMENVTINVYGAEGQNVRELAQQVSEIISDKTARRRAVYA